MCSKPRRKCSLVPWHDHRSRFSRSVDFEKPDEAFRKRLPELLQTHEGKSPALMLSRKDSWNCSTSVQRCATPCKDRAASTTGLSFRSNTVTDRSASILDEFSYVVDPGDVLIPSVRCAYHRSRCICQKPFSLSEDDPSLDPRQVGRREHYRDTVWGERYSVHFEGDRDDARSTCNFHGRHVEVGSAMPREGRSMAISTSKRRCRVVEPSAPQIRKSDKVPFERPEAVTPSQGGSRNLGRILRNLPGEFACRYLLSQIRLRNRRQ